MKNIELFNLFAADIFSRLYQRFPLPTEISPVNLVNDQSYDEISSINSREIAGHTLQWLSEAGYIVKIGEITPFRYVLSVKGLEILNARSFITANNRSLSLGEQLVEAFEGVVTDAARDEAKGLVQKILGWGLNIGVVAVTSTFGS